MKVLANGKRLVNAVLARWGHAVANTGVVPSFDRLAVLIDRHGLTPRTVFDVGVAHGTPWLYAAYPKAKYFLIDPTFESLPHMRSWAERLDAEVINVALGETDGTVEIDVRDDIGGSSLFQEIGPYWSAGRYRVPVRRFDGLIDRFEPPALCKIDVQGAEVMVLRGMGERLKEMDVVIIETSLIATVRDGPEVVDVIGIMSEAGFVLYDIVGVVRRPLDKALAQIDAVFVPWDSVLRRDRRWTAEKP